MMEQQARNGIIDGIRETLLPGASASRSRGLTGVLTSLNETQLLSVQRAVEIAKASSSLSLVRDAVESSDFATVNAADKWGRILNVRAVEAALNAEFAGTRNYDVYSPAFEAHIEAYATYHDRCYKCEPYDRDLDEDFLESDAVTDHGHYIDYLQDYDLMDAVEHHPARVTELVRFAVEHRGITPSLLEDFLSAPARTLVDGLL